AGVVVCLFLGGPPELVGGPRHDPHCGFRNPLFPPAGEKSADFAPGNHLSAISQLFPPGADAGGGAGSCLPLSSVPVSGSGAAGGTASRWMRGIIPAPRGVI